MFLLVVSWSGSKVRPAVQFATRQDRTNEIGASRSVERGGNRPLTSAGSTTPVTKLVDLQAVTT
jgi:hypothetical protein